VHTALGQLELGLPPNGGKEPNEARPRTKRSFMDVTAGLLRLMIRNAVAAPPFERVTKKRPPGVARMARRYCSLGRNAVRNGLRTIRHLAKPLSAFCDGNLAAIKLQHKQPQRMERSVLIPGCLCKWLSPQQERTTSKEGLRW
jgi:hypothetical protein